MAALFSCFFASGEGGYSARWLSASKGHARRQSQRYRRVGFLGLVVSLVFSCGSKVTSSNVDMNIGEQCVVFMSYLLMICLKPSRSRTAVCGIFWKLETGVKVALRLSGPDALAVELQSFTQELEKKTFLPVSADTRLEAAAVCALKCPHGNRFVPPVWLNQSLYKIKEALLVNLSIVSFKIYFACFFPELLRTWPTCIMWACTIPHKCLLHWQIMTWSAIWCRSLLRRWTNG